VHASLARTEASINSYLACLPRFSCHRWFDRAFRGSVRYRGGYLPRADRQSSPAFGLDRQGGRPSGEALIMTAIGLLVAVPAVLAYNFCRGP
jgi:biopolymer transport protein ExbB